MIISESHRAIFVHVQKTAGTSIERTLENSFPDSMVWLGRHGHAVEGIKAMGRERWDEYFSFAFVRNPWDRLVSWYSMVTGMQANLPFWKKWSKAPFDSPFHNQVISQSNSFESFLINCTDVVFEKGAHKSYAFNQVQYLSDEDGQIAVKFIGRFENLEQDMQEICRRLGVEYQPLPKKNLSKHAHYSAYYNNETRDLVAQRFAKDIEAFGYQFDKV